VTVDATGNASADVPWLAVYSAIRCSSHYYSVVGMHSLIATVWTWGRATHSHWLQTWPVKQFSVYLSVLKVKRSGVTRVGVTRGGNWRVTPIFPLKTDWRPFLVIAVCKVVTFLAVVSNSRPLTSFLLNLATIFFIRVSSPGWCPP